MAIAFGFEITAVNNEKGVAERTVISETPSLFQDLYGEDSCYWAVIWTTVDLEVND